MIARKQAGRPTIKSRIGRLIRQADRNAERRGTARKIILTAVATGNLTWLEADMKGAR